MVQDGEPQARASAVFQLDFSAKMELGSPCGSVKSNLMVAVLHENKRDGTLEEIDRTKVFVDGSELRGELHVYYRFGAKQPLIFRVYDVDPEFRHTPIKKLQLHEQVLLAESSFPLSLIVTRTKKTYSVKPDNKVMRQQIKLLTVQAEEIEVSRKIVFRCPHLAKKDKLPRKGQYLKISREAVNGVSDAIIVTELVINNRSPMWTASLSMQQIESKDDKVIVEGFNFSSKGNHTMFGKWQVSVSDLKLCEGKSAAIHPYCGHEKVNKGQLFVDTIKSNSFLDYIGAGHELGFIVAVDFAETNGDPESVKSLHYVNPSGDLNAYQQVIKGVGNAIEFFDSDRCCGAWCFGGKTKDGKMSCCFNLNLNPTNCEVKGVKGIMEAYVSALKHVKLHKRPSLGEVIKKASDFAQSHNHYPCEYDDYPCKYYVLLIVTNGDMVDVPGSIDALVKASYLPLSIVIVGLDEGKSFVNMEKLGAGNGHPLENSDGLMSMRDIVRFVPKYKVPADEECMAEYLLEEIPKQFLTYKQMTGTSLNRR